MSNCHAKIIYYKPNQGMQEAHQEGFFLEDVGSTNRTWLRLSAEGEQSNLHPLRVNDILKIGSTVFVVQNNDIGNLKNLPMVNKRMAS
jgi:pSer/pThr/pTyr-binding forkhead associated (FHA) protein